MSDNTRPITMRNESGPSEEKPPEVGIAPTPTDPPESIGIQTGPPDLQSFQNATRLLAGLPRWRKPRRRLYVLGLVVSPIPCFLLWHHLVGSEWWYSFTGLGLIWIAYVLAYLYLWDWLSGKYKRAISVVWKASAEPSIGAILDASCLLPITIAPWREFKHTLIERLGRVTSPNDDSLTDLQLGVLHDIVLGRHLPTSFDTASHVTLLNALVYLGDSRTVACLQELIAGGGKFRRNEAVQTGARKYLVYTLTLMKQTRSEANQKVKDLYSGSDKTRDDEVVRAAAQECLVRLQARLAAESQRASLLRSSDQTSLPSATLLRPTTTEADSTAPEQLLRARSKP